MTHDGELSQHGTSMTLDTCFHLTSMVHAEEQRWMNGEGVLLVACSQSFEINMYVEGTINENLLG